MWQLLDVKTYSVPADGYILIAGDFNGHVGEKADGNRCHVGTAKPIADSKTVSYEIIAPQHGVLRITPPIKEREERRIAAPPIKEEMISLTRIPSTMNLEELWNQSKDIMHKAASVTLGVTKLGKPYTNQDTRIWNDDVEMKVREKNASTTSFSMMKRSPIGKFIRMPTGKQRKRSLSPDRYTTIN